MWHRFSTGESDVAPVFNQWSTVWGLMHGYAHWLQTSGTIEDTGWKPVPHKRVERSTQGNMDQPPNNQVPSARAPTARKPEDDLAAAVDHRPLTPKAGTPEGALSRGSAGAQKRDRWFGLRKPAGRAQIILLGIACIVCVFGAWSILTSGQPEERIWGPTVLPSPKETFNALPTLWTDRELMRNTGVTLKRVVLGFALACTVGVPLGVLCGCFSPVGAFMAPLTLVGRNIPIAALIPLTFSLFGIGEQQKIMFIFIACVAFIIADVAGAIADVEERYVDTAFTLGARTRQIVMKVLVPLAIPSVFNSLRVLFGLAFGYIMLAELVKFGGEAGGLGDIIIMSQRRGQREHILLVLMIIPLIALGLDRILYLIQRSLFPHRYGGRGTLNRAVAVLVHRWEDFKGLFWTSAAVAVESERSGADAGSQATGEPRASARADAPASPSPPVAHDDAAKAAAESVSTESAPPPSDSARSGGGDA